ncbi:hypothetical protein N658DRAFT_437434 [Parathielavia hyrcaniae]|uniref:Uncharacterized protein n=1 Tax=Parathielavia hyrcaniae TaxID=113614 RepID=A0AAN6PQF8_9PEZI|nr:hypothetical protein N658DRAFT_437434 [Parathielavia hyrcaniae]
MCRLVVFKGTCPHCKEAFTWDELAQELSCLEAKNNGAFGMCKDGALEDEKEHDQECDACAAELEADEGYHGGTDDAIEALSDHKNKEAADLDQGSGKHRNKKQRTS